MSSRLTVRSTRWLLALLLAGVLLAGVAPVAAHAAPLHHPIRGTHRYTPQHGSPRLAVRHVDATAAASGLDHPLWIAGGRLRNAGIPVLLHYGVTCPIRGPPLVAA